MGFGSRLLEVLGLTENEKDIAGILLAPAKAEGVVLTGEGLSAGVKALADNAVAGKSLPSLSRADTVTMQVAPVALEQSRSGHNGV